jgi:hypothetical protein
VRRAKESADAEPARSLASVEAPISNEALVTRRCRSDCSGIRFALAGLGRRQWPASRCQLARRRPPRRSCDGEPTPGPGGCHLTSGHPARGAGSVGAQPEEGEVSLGPTTLWELGDVGSHIGEEALGADAFMAPLEGELRVSRAPLETRGRSASLVWQVSLPDPGNALAQSPQAGRRALGIP